MYYTVTALLPSLPFGDNVGATYAGESLGDALRSAATVHLIAPDANVAVYECDGPRQTVVLRIEGGAWRAKACAA